MTGFSYDGHVISGESHLLVVALHVGQLLLQTFKLQVEITSGEGQAFFESSETIDICLRIHPHGHLHIMPECSVFHINLFFQSLYNVPFINNYTPNSKIGFSGTYLLLKSSAAIWALSICRVTLWFSVYLLRICEMNPFTL